jgi:EAL domain-containing protein (putative c-di-GMP-specific phosphodiesterase class I)/GGDEF domain-containing protein/PAS domain-containing protein
MATPSPVRLLIADLSENRAHEIDSVLRDAGISTRPKFFSDLAAATEHASIDGLDLMLCTAEFDQLSELLPKLRSREPDLPIIVHDDAPDAANLSRGMSFGATDVIFRDDNERLLHVVRRELHHVCQQRRLVETDRALKEAERRCELLLANSTAAIAYVHEGMHIYANDDYLRLFGFEDADDLLGLPLLDLIDPYHADEVKARMKAIRAVGAQVATVAASEDGNAEETTSGTDEPTFTFLGRTLSNEPVEGDMTLSSADYEGEPCIQVLVRSGVTNARSTKASEPAAEPSGGPAAVIEVGADPVATFVNLVKPRVDEVPSATLLVVEIDDFNDLQAEHGLSEAKRIVAEIGRWFAEDLTDVLVERIADHRFGMIASGSEASGDVLAEQLRAEVEDELFEVNGVTIRCTVTIGAITVTPDSLLREGVDLAFKAMLAARETKGTNSVLWYKPDDSQVDEDGLDEDQRRILGLVNEAIDGNRFQLLFQPTISLRGDAEEHYEVFLRLTDDDDQQLAPHQFLELAIEHGVAAKIDRWVILHSIKMLAAHRTEGHNTRLTINLTSNSLTDEEFIQWLAVAIKAARMPSDAVIFQIAEPDAASHVRQARQFVQGLAAMHCRSSMRHFGLNDSSFETLRHVPVDFVKLDGTQVREMEDSPTNREQLAAVIEQLQGMGKLTVVPMVESATVLSALWQAGANYIQGHYLQEPTPEMDYDFTTED